MAVGRGTENSPLLESRCDFDFFPDFYDQNLGLGATVDAEMGMKRAHKSNFYPSFGKRDHQYKRPFSPSFGKRAQPVSFFHTISEKKERKFIRMDGE